MPNETSTIAAENDRVLGEDSQLSEYPLRPVVVAWMNKIKRAKKFKKDRFQDDADESLKFYECGKQLHELMWDGAHLGGHTMWQDGEEMTPAPKFKVVVGKVAELVQRFGPAIYHQNPTVVVEPKTVEYPQDKLVALIPPQMIQQAQMQAQQSGQQFNIQSLLPQDDDKAQTDVSAITMQFLLNYMQRENDKKRHSRRMAEEALIKGAGLLWTDYKTPYPDGPKMIVSEFDTVDNLFLDPDAEQRENGLWCAKLKWRPVWEVAAQYDLDEEELRKKYAVVESVNSQEEGKENPDHRDDQRLGRTNDLMPVYEIWSKMGMGHKLSGVKNVEGIKDYLDSMGDNVYLVISEKVPYPLNLHHDRIVDVITEPDEDQQSEKYDGTFMDVQWPIPFWEFGDWPYTMVAFRETPSNPWPMPYVKPAIGHLKFINWCMSFLVNKVRTSCCTMISAMKALDEETKQRLLDGKDFKILEVDHNLVADGDISKAVHVLQFPPFQQDIYIVLEKEMEAFDKATGLTALMYGSPGGMRSSAEAQEKSKNANAPLDDMASRMEDAMSLVARKEAMAARWILDAQDVQPILGKMGASFWQQYVASKDFTTIAREYHYRVEAGSMRKPNKEAQAALINQAITAWMPALQFALSHGDVGPVNEMFQKWSDANEFEAHGPLLQPPPPPPPDPNMLKVQAEIEGQKQESQLKQQEMGMKLQGEQAKQQLDLQKARMDMQVNREKAQQELQLGQAQMQQEAQLAMQKGRIDLETAEMAGRLKMHEFAQNARIKQAEAQQSAGIRAHEAVQDSRIKEQQARAQIAAAKNKPQTNGSKA